MTARAAALMFALALAAPSDTLLLRDGTKVTGRWWSADAGQIHFLVDNQLQHYARADVSAVAFGDAALPAKPGAAPTAHTAPAVAPAAPAHALPQPDQLGAVYFQSASGDLMALEHTQATERHRSAAQSWEMPSAHSRVRLKQTLELVFVVRLPEGTDPSTFSLYPLEPAKDARVTQAGPASQTAPLTAPFVVGKLGESTYSLTVKDLAAGEYAFSPATSNAAYCFAVDGPARGR